MAGGLAGVPALAKDLGSVNCRRVLAPELGVLAAAVRALADLVVQVVSAGKVRALANCRRDVEERWQEQSLVAARRFCRVWATVRGTLAIGRANCRIERPRSGAVICKIACRRAIAIRTARTGAMTSGKTGKIGMTTITISTTIGTMEIVTILGTGGVTCGRITRRSWLLAQRCGG